MVTARHQIYDPKSCGLIVTKYSGDEAICRCPFHDDTRPSASFNLYTGVFFCFGCGAAYPPYKLASKLGGHVEKVTRTAEHRGVDDKEWRILYRNNLAIGDPYLASRGVKKRFVEALDIKANDWAVIFPFFSHKGLDGLLLRRKEGTPKYVVYGERPPLYPSYDMVLLERQSRCFIVEGVFGALRARSAGVFAYATLGAMIKESVAPILSTVPGQVYGLFDNDFAGYVAGGRLLHFCPSAKIVVPGGEADEMSIEDWEYYNKGELYTTRCLSELARLSKDPDKFWTYMPKSYSVG